MTDLLNIILPIFLVFSFFVAIFIYNRLVKLRQTRNRSFSDIDVQLKLRYDLLPNLVSVVKQYASHEQKVLTQITEARTNAINTKDISGRSKAESNLSASIGNLFAVAENYPDLKANQNFIELQRELSDIENKISAARRFFNNSTSELNSAIEQFPAVLFAKLFGFKEESFFEIENQEEKKPVKVEF